MSYTKWLLIDEDANSTSILDTCFAVTKELAEEIFDIEGWVIGTIMSEEDYVKASVAPVDNDIPTPGEEHALSDEVWRGVAMDISEDEYDGTFGQAVGYATSANMSEEEQFNTNIDDDVDNIDGFLYHDACGDR